MPTPHTPRAAWQSDLLLAALLVTAAVALRLVAADQILADGGLWIFQGDPAYHLRRGLMTLADWPRAPIHDPFVNFPQGGQLYWPPGMAWGLAGLAKLLGVGVADRGQVEWIASLVPPVVGGLTVLLVYLGTRRFGRAPAFIAAAIVAVVPANLQVTVIGRYDHHMFEPLLSWAVIWCVASSASVGPERPAMGRIVWALAGSLCVGLAHLVWPGVLLHLGLIAASLWLAVLWLHLDGRGKEHDLARRLARAAALVFSFSLLTSLPAVVASPWSEQPVFFAASPLHLACLATAALVFALQGFLPRRLCWRPGPWLLLLFSLGPVGLLLAIPALRQAIFGGIGYSMSSQLLAISPEAQGLGAEPLTFLAVAGWPALFCSAAAALWLLRWGRLVGRAGKETPSHSTGAVEGDRLHLVVLLCAALLFLAPGLLRSRWLAAWSPLGACAVALLWVHWLRPLGQRWLPGKAGRFRVWFTIALLGLMVPSLLYSLSLQVIPEGHRAAQRMARRMRTLTPSSAPDELSAAGQPAYGVLANWGVGHLLSYAAGRPAMATPFFGTSGHDEANRRAFQLLLDGDCDNAAEQMARLRLRYLLFTPLELRGLPAMASVAGRDPEPFEHRSGRRLSAALSRSLLMRLGPRDGQSVLVQRRLLPACGRFRLVAEASIGRARAGQPGDLKLYERVPGAELVVAVPRSARLEVAVQLVTEGGRRLVWFHRSIGGPSRRVTIRVPYATDGSCWAADGSCPVRVASPAALVRVGDRVRRVKIPAAAVERGGRIVVPW